MKRGSYKNYMRVTGLKSPGPHAKLRTQPEPGHKVLTIVGNRNVAVTV